MRPSEPQQMCMVSRETLKHARIALRALKINSVNRAAYVRAKIEAAYEEITKCSLPTRRRRRRSHLTGTDTSVSDRLARFFGGELLGELDDQAFRTAEIAEPVGVSV